MNLHWARTRLATAELPEATQTFLVTQGLPEKVGDIFAANPEGDEVVGGGFEIARSGGGEYPICVDREGAVWVVMRRPEVSRRFVNSSVASLAAFLDRFEAVSDDALAFHSHDSLHSQLSIVENLRNEMRTLDPAALADPDWFWSEVLDYLADTAPGC